MNYEKKYKEALNWMKDVYPTLEGAAKEDAEHYFPELKESRDERIKEDIIWCLKHSGIKPDKPINPHVRTTMKDALTWLEKQAKRGIEPFEAEHGKYYYCIKDYFCGGKKQASKGDVIQALRGLPIMGLKDASEYFLPVNSIKCNSNWSEEDEDMLQSILDEYKSMTTEKRNWLKSIKDIVQPQTKQERNEDTQQWIDAIIKDYEEWYKVNKDHRATIQIEIDILKSLKERYTWSPSEEQMKYLSAAIEESNENPVLESLYKDLKKLKE